jgi:hypothetical protein
MSNVLRLKIIYVFGKWIVTICFESKWKRPVNEIRIELYYLTDIDVKVGKIAKRSCCQIYFCETQSIPLETRTVSKVSYKSTKNDNQIKKPLSLHR